MLYILENESSSVQTQSEPTIPIKGRALCLDLGARRVGVAVSDEMQLSVRPIATIKRTNWKKLLCDVRALCEEFDAQMLIVGLPLRLDGAEGEAAKEARRLANNFARSLRLPVFLQNEQLTTREAASWLRAKGLRGRALEAQLDAEAAAEILRNFLAERNSS